MRERVVHAKFEAGTNDGGLGQLLKWRPDDRAVALDARLRRKRGQVAERGYEFRAAVGIARVVHRIHADDDARRIDRLGPGQRQ